MPNDRAEKSWKRTVFQMNGILRVFSMSHSMPVHISVLYVPANDCLNWANVSLWAWKICAIFTIQAWIPRFRIGFYEISAKLSPIPINSSGNIKNIHWTQQTPLNVHQIASHRRHSDSFHTSNECADCCYHFTCTQINDVKSSLGCHATQFHKFSWFVC